MKPTREQDTGEGSGAANRVVRKLGAGEKAKAMPSSHETSKRGIDQGHQRGTRMLCNQWAMQRWHLVSARPRCL